jgi:hypothetical protein
MSAPVSAAWSTRSHPRERFRAFHPQATTQHRQRTVSLVYDHLLKNHPGIIETICLQEFRHPMPDNLVVKLIPLHHRRRHAGRPPLKATTRAATPAAHLPRFHLRRGTGPKVAHDAKSAILGLIPVAVFCTGTRRAPAPSWYGSADRHILYLVAVVGMSLVTPD